MVLLCSAQWNLFNFRRARQIHLTYRLNKKNKKTESTDLLLPYIQPHDTAGLFVMYSPHPLPQSRDGFLGSSSEVSDCSSAMK